MQAVDFKQMRDALSVIENIMIKYEPANAGAGKAESVAKKSSTKKEATAAKSAVKTIGEEEDETITFGAKEPQTITLKKGLGLPLDKMEKEQTKALNNAKDAIKKTLKAMTPEERKAKTWDEHVKGWLHTKTETTKTDDDVEHLSIEDLLAEADELTETETVGIYERPSTGAKVTGPSRSDEEGLDNSKCKKFLIGETTKRVYTNDDEETFMGYAGIGKHKEIEEA